MSTEGYFELYVDTLSEAMKNIRKNFKKINTINELLTKFEMKEVYGRIKPSNYLLLFLIALGGKNSKLYTPIILTIQKLFSNNFINPDEELSGSIQFLKQEHEEFLFLPISDYSNKSFQELYIETLVALPDKNDALNLLICKNMGLIFRLSQNNLPVSLIANICDFLIDSILQNRTNEYDKILKSTFLEIVRHAIESLKEASDRKLLEDDEEISVKQVCERYGAILADQVAIKLNVEANHEVPDYLIIPKKGYDQNKENFKVLEFSEINEKNEQNGKFGWCIICRKAANFYCRVERVPVCSYECKQVNYHQTRNLCIIIEELEKFCHEETKSFTVFTSHVEAFCKIFSKYLAHQDIRKRSGFADIFIHLSSELRKISIKTTSPKIISCLQDIFRQCCTNIVLETDAITACGVAVKKLIPLEIFTPQLEILLHEIANKIKHFLTPVHIKDEILKLVRDFIRSEVIFDIFMSIDCKEGHRDVVHEVFHAISSVYVGITSTEGISSLPPEDPNIKKLCYEVLNVLEKSIRENKKILGEDESLKLEEVKKNKNLLKIAIKRFNECEKPTKIIKKLISEKFFSKDVKEIAEFLHKHSKRLSFVNIGQLIGDHDPLGIGIRDEYIKQMEFKGHIIDEGMRILLTHFTIPGESQIVDRIIESFSKEYYSQNLGLGEEIFKNSDAIYSFSYLLMMLQTNLHNPQVQEPMTFLQFSNLSKNMNGKGSEFPEEFLGNVYESIKKKQLGFHSKLKEIEVINAFTKGEFKKAQEIHLKHLDTHLKKEYSYLQLSDTKPIPKCEKYDIRLLCSELFGEVIRAASVKVREPEEKYANIDLIEELIKFSLSLGIEKFVAISIKSIWEELSKTNTNKKYALINRTFIWVQEFTPYLYDQWSTIIHSFSMFHRTKAIKTDKNSKNGILVNSDDKCYVYESFIESVLAKSSKFNYRNLICLIDALVECSKEEVAEGQIKFCLEKIGDVFEYNNSRLTDVVPLIWPKLKEYYIELVKNKAEDVALFCFDFLKQLVTKFIKKKDLQFYQKEYMKPFQEIFNYNVPLGVKEYIVGGLIYFVNNYFPNIKDGWKVILSILCDSFEEEEDPMVKEKSHAIVKKIYETNFSIIDLDENYVDYVQILGRMAREKDEVYIKSCLVAIKTILSFYESKFSIDVENVDSESNQKLDMTFWQTMWLPLLSTIYGICGDFRADVQNESIELLFHILMRYGKLFKYEFWKMILQGILRPTFEEITYTSQSKPLRKKELEEWLRNSFSQLFSDINKLILTYFHDFKLFLPDILKIYESCIISNSNKILTQLSTEALTELLSSVGDQFENLNWTEYIEFIKVVFKKSCPNEIECLENWSKSQEVPEIQSIYQGKILTLYLILINCQTVIEKYSDKLQENNILELKEVINDTYEFCNKFNKNVELRGALWKRGFFEDMKSLPGLIKQEHEGLKGVTLIKFSLIEKSDTYIDEYVQHSFKIFENYKKCLILAPLKERSVEAEEKEREGIMLQIIILENTMEDLKEIGLPKLFELGYKTILFKNILEVCNVRTFSSVPNPQEYEKITDDRDHKFSEIMKEWILKIFEFENETKK